MAKTAKVLKLLQAYPDAVVSDGDPAEKSRRLAGFLLKHPKDPDVLLHCMSEMAGPDGEAGFCWAMSIQDEVDVPIYSVLNELVRRKGETAPRRRFGRVLDRARQGPLTPVARVWDAVLDRRAPDPAEAKLVAQDRGAWVEPFFRFILPLPTVLDLGDARLSDEAEGIRVAPLRAFLRDFLAAEPRWSAALAAAPLPSAEARRRALRLEGANGWVHRALAEGRLTMMDPLDGQLRTATDGLIGPGGAIYRFDGVEPFFLMVGGLFADAQGLLLPRRGLAISFGGENQDLLCGRLHAGLMAAYLRARAKADPAPEPRPGPPHFSLHLRTFDMFAHHMWNMLPALERLVRLGQLDHVGTVHYAGPDIFGPLPGLFPELAAVRYDRTKKPGSVFDPAPYDPGGLPLPAGSFVIPRSLIERIIRTMRALPRGRPDAVEPADIPRLPGTPVVWLGLRMRGRRWVSQESGFAHVIRHIAARRPDTLFLLDGFSHPVVDTSVVDKWKDAIDALSAIAERIRAAAPHPDRVVNMVGNTMRESVLWAAETHAYFCPFGSTQHKVAWFTSGAGLVYAPPAFPLDRAMGTPGFAACEVSALPRLIIGSPVETGERELGPPRPQNASIANQELDAQEVADILWGMLRDAGFGAAAG